MAPGPAGENWPRALIGTMPSQPLGETLWLTHQGKDLPIRAALGRPPRDLLEVMAALAAGSPANAALRALSRTAGEASHR